MNENNPVSIITFLIYILCRSNPSSLKFISDQKKKLISKKKIPGYKHISDLMSATFEPPVKLIKETSASVGLDVHEIEPLLPVQREKFVFVQHDIHILFYVLLCMYIYPQHHPPLRKDKCTCRISTILAEMTNILNITQMLCIYPCQ
jgi:hypothetical protein